MADLLSVNLAHMQYAEQETRDLTAKHAKAWDILQKKVCEPSYPLNLPFTHFDTLDKIAALAADWRGRFRNVLLLGIGGSALGTRSILQFIKGPYFNLDPGNNPRMFILDNIDPAWISELEKQLDFSETGLIYISKSGSTPETAASFVYFYDKYISGGGQARDVTIICDPAENGINRIAARLQCNLLHIWPQMPGRYTVLSPAGLFPAALMGIAGEEILAGAQQVSKHFQGVPFPDNPIGLLGACIFDQAIHRNKCIHVLFSYSSMLAEFGLWFAQLWGESLGKNLDVDNKTTCAGTTPLPCVGATDQHSLLQLFREGPADKVYGFVHILGEDACLELPELFQEEKEFSYLGRQCIGHQMNIERISTEISLTGNGQPCYSLGLKDRSAASLGALFFFYEALVVWMANLWKVNPFIQPGVEEGKNMTYTLMGREGEAYSASYEAVRTRVLKHEQEGRIYFI